MSFCDSIRLLFLSFVLICASRSNGKSDYSQIFEENCSKLTKEPYFEPDMVVGAPWRIYYTWNMDLETKCMDMVFKNVTHEILNRVYNDMVDYLEMQPFWQAATLLVTLGQASHEMLLFADQGSAGRFIGVPNVVRDGNISPNKNAVPLIRINMKLIHDGKYLVTSDCNVGVSTLLARRGSNIYRAEIEGVASNLELGIGKAACLTDYNSAEKVDNIEV